ncbi:MAG: universal stress protein [bacterium]|jgi:nucleotide-binding universal stress UspA family protein
MLPFKRILCPTDFSDYSYQALQAADELAGHFSAELLIVHIVSTVPLAPVVPGVTPTTFKVDDYQKELEESSKKTLKEVVEKRVSRAPTVRTIVSRGPAAEEIVKVAEAEKAGLTVISTHGVSGLQRILFGSVAEKVVRDSKCPVLTIQASDTD